jgi:DNA-binding transcriptional regulator YiaG
MNRPYPWKCGECKAKAVVPALISHAAQVKHEGVIHDVVVPELPVHRCDQCKTIVFGEEADHAIRTKLRDDLGLFQPEQIRANRLAFGLTQDELGLFLSCAGETVSRWECGVIQSRASDKMLRAF